MTCETATNLISFRIDGEISAADQTALEEHLATCAACRATMDVLSSQDSDLVRAFAPRRRAAAAVADAAIARVHREHVQSFRPRRFPFLTMLVSAAAGFALALLVLQPWHKAPVGTGGPIVTTQPAPNTTPAIARLALATGAIEVQPPGKTNWEVMPTGAEIAPNSKIRTPDKVRCEVVMSDNSTIRLNYNSEVEIGSGRDFKLASGQMYSSVAKAADPFIVSVAQASITALGTEFDIAADAQKATLTVVEGSTRVKGKSGERIVNSGNRINIVAGTPGEAEAVFSLPVATRWVNELLVMKGRDSDELRKRVDLLLASIGNEKMTYMFEDEIRALGDHCVLPLTRYLQSPLSAGDPRKRHQAARILTDVAQPWSIPQMIELLNDKDGEVRFYAARALVRLANQNMGRNPEDWRNQKFVNTISEWEKWWQSNKDRYPGGPMSPSPSPNAPPLKEVKAKG
ncbi:MAG TPA: FecR domain-containing protein [Tepidisphaeraceae bacterium]|jgi:ferric-dicitrate binding protein FerR (iron transport regulator)|nr:FecR domain-containing protein [Tepidisphaeraceae bacterium]